MQQVIVNDASVLIDIHKAGFLGAYSEINYHLVIPDVVYEELASIEAMILDDVGFEVVELDGTQVLSVKNLIDEYSGLTIADSFALIVSESIPGSILLTGDLELRKIASTKGVEVHGVLWLLDEMYRQQLLTSVQVMEALVTFENDPAVRLPGQILADYKKRYRNL